MSGARHFYVEHDRKRMHALKERREQEREARLDRQDEQLIEVVQGSCVWVCACGQPTNNVVCDDCYAELGGES